MLTLIALSLALTAATPHSVTVYGGDASFVQELEKRLPPGSTVKQATLAAEKVKAHPAEELVAQGKTHYQDLFFEEAIPTLKKAREAYEKGSITLESWPGYWEALLYLALTYDAIGNEMERDAALDAFAATDPDPGVLTSQFPPPFRELVSNRLAKKPARRGSIRVESEPKGALVHINGRPAGRTPVVAVDLHGGPHQVTVELDGYVRYAKAVDVRAGFGIGAEATPDLVDVQLVRASGQAASAAAQSLTEKNLPDATVTEALKKELGERSDTIAVFLAPGADKLVLGALPAERKWHGPESFPKDALSVPPLRERVLSKTVDWITWKPPVVQKKPVDTAVTVKAEPDLTAPPTPVSIEEDEEGSRWWLWTALGVVTTGAIAAAVIASQPAESGQQTGTVVIDWSLQAPMNWGSAGGSHYSRGRH